MFGKAAPGRPLNPGRCHVAHHEAQAKMRYLKFVAWSVAILGAVALFLAVGRLIDGSVRSWDVVRGGLAIGLAMCGWVMLNKASAGQR